jgi:hypothetical protein
MKKLILGTLALIGACSMADANTLTINNTTGCTYTLSIGGIGNYPGPFPTVAVPGTSSFNSYPPSSGISAIKILFTDVTGANGGTSVGNTVPYGSTMGSPAPACPTTFGYITAVWQVATNGDVTLTIL